MLLHTKRREGKLDTIDNCTLANEANFVDYAKIFCRSGRGGNGSVHFRREKYIPKGGPDGGDGGRGGSIYVRANRNYWTLIHLRYNRHLFAENGESGGGALKTGASGKDLYIEVPEGTAIYDAETGNFVMELTRHGEEKILLEGGYGGKGNDRFKSATNQAPRTAQKGGAAKEATFIFQLKTLADVGLVGFPNAGKSTLLAAVSAAKPKIANYPFTTLVPSVGIVSYREGKSFVMADIPGIIEGASEGKGLGLRFLRHIERNSILLLTIPIDAEDIAKDFEILCNELAQYEEQLLQKRMVLAITKCDLADEEIIEWRKHELPEGVPHCFISAVTGQGMTELLDLLWKELNKPLPYDNTEIVHSPLAQDQLGQPLAEKEEETDNSSLSEDGELLDIEWDDDIKEEMGLDL